MHIFGGEVIFSAPVRKVIRPYEGGGGEDESMREEHRQSELAPKTFT